MIGTIVNTLAIIAGSIIGLLFSEGISKNYKITIMQSVGLAVIIIGI